MSLDALLKLARNLLDHHLYFSSMTVLMWVDPKTRNMEWNKLQNAVKPHAQNPAPRNGLYVLAAAENRRKAVSLPIEAEQKFDRAKTFSIKTQESIRNAEQVVKKHFGNEHLPRMMCILTASDDTGLEIRGDSIGLAAALAFVQRLSGRDPDIPVFATGALSPDGCVQSVGDLEEKVNAALGDLGKSDGRVLIPSQNGCHFSDPRVQAVHTVAEAIELLWGKNVSVDPELLNINEQLRIIQRSTEHEHNLERLQSLLGHGKNLQAADRLQLLNEKMIQLRHLGRTREADEVHAEIQDMLAGDHYLDPGHIQEIEVQGYATRLDFFPKAWYRDEIRSYLERHERDLSWVNRIRLQGILAMYESMTGRHAEAIDLREKNLEIHLKRSDLRENLPETLCHLVWECARGGSREKFEKYAAQLEEETLKLPPDLLDIQQRYNHHAVAAGLVALGESHRLLDFIMGAPQPIPCLDERFRQWCTASEQVTRHPEISTLRALLRMYRRCGRPHDAVALQPRFSPKTEPGNLTQFLFWLCQLELELARAETGNADPRAVCDLANKLRYCHIEAARFYMNLLQACVQFDGSTTAIQEIERYMDPIYY